MEVEISRQNVAYLGLFIVKYRSIRKTHVLEKNISNQVWVIDI